MADVPLPVLLTWHHHALLRRDRWTEAPRVCAAWTRRQARVARLVELKTVILAHGHEAQGGEEEGIQHYPSNVQRSQQHLPSQLLINTFATRCFCLPLAGHDRCPALKSTQLLRCDSTTGPARRAVRLLALGDEGTVASEIGARHVGKVHEDAAGRDTKRRAHSRRQRSHRLPCTRKDKERISMPTKPALPRGACRTLTFVSGSTLPMLRSWIMAHDCSGNSSTSARERNKGEQQHRRAYVIRGLEEHGRVQRQVHHDDLFRLGQCPGQRLGDGRQRRLQLHAALGHVARHADVRHLDRLGRTEGRPAMARRPGRSADEGDDADQAHNAIAKQPLICIVPFICYIMLCIYDK